MTRALVHLHPDFQGHLEEILEKWNSVQHSIRFTGLRPRRKDEHSLLTPGAISLEEASQVADGIRRDAGYSSQDGILVFTERRLHTEGFYQLFVGGHERDEDPPGIAILSLHFLRRSYEQEPSLRPMLFRAVLSNMLFSIARDAGLNDHGDDIRGCIMDFCAHMPDIEKGLRDGPKFCVDCTERLHGSEAAFLLALAGSARDFRNLQAIDTAITESIVLRGQRYEQIPKEFDYHVALSFAGPDRDKADALAQALVAAGLKPFYDEDAQAHLWGKNLQIYLSELYCLRACFCIVLVSANYSQSRWTKVELEAALAKEFERGNEYILPLRLDDSEVPGILPTRAYLKWGEQPVEAIAALVRQKIFNSKPR